MVDCMSEVDKVQDIFTINFGAKTVLRMDPLRLCLHGTEAAMKDALWKITENTRVRIGGSATLCETCMIA